MRLTRFLRRSIGALCACLLSTSAWATWSIVVMDTATGEIVVAGATCLSGNLRNLLGVVVVGRGVAAAQASVDGTASTRILIWDGIRAGDTPQEILAALSAFDNAHQSRQYGIVSLDGPPVTFTGLGAIDAALGVSGTVGSVRYAMQGNILTGDPVVLEMEQTFLSATGDLGQRVMAAMETARSYGGDGRCSCPGQGATACGSPPPMFDRSALSAFIVIARPGDEDGACAQGLGCANGDYYLDKRHSSQAFDPDPVVRLKEKYDEWRATKIGVADHYLSQVLPAAQALVADGVTSTDVLVRLRDIDGNQLAFGGQTLSTRAVGAPAATVAQTVDNGDGTHTIRLRAGTAPGRARWRVVVEDGVDTVFLDPLLEVDVDPVRPLHAGFTQVSASGGAEVPLVVNVSAAAGRPYLLIAGASGTDVGSFVNGRFVPLNADRLTRFTLGAAGSAFLPGTVGQLDALGRAQGALRFTPRMLAPFVGGHIDVVGLLGQPDALLANTVGFDVVP